MSALGDAEKELYLMTNMNQQYDIVIVGGGMVGASLACLLAHAQPAWSIALIESHPLAQDAADTEQPHYQASFDARSTALSRGSIEIFQQLGLWDLLQQHATSIGRVHISDKGHIAGAEIDAKDYCDSTTELNLGVGAVVENAWLGSVLLQQLSQISNLTVLAPATVVKLQPKQGGYQLDVEGDEARSLSTSLCLICDGANSQLRRAVGIEADVIDYHQQAIIANIELSEPHGGVAYERFTDTGPMALLPLGESELATKAALVWTLPTEQADQTHSMSDKDFLAELQRRFGYRVGRFVGVGQRHCYPLQLSTASEQVRSHLALMGNSAHFLHPVAGQGFNLALRDCAILVDELLLATSKGEPLGQLPMLQRYIDRQGFDQQVTIGFSHAITQIFSSSSLPKMALRALGFIGLECVPPAKHGLAEQTMGTFGSGARLGQ